jgi:hypothetical protein
VGDIRSSGDEAGQRRIASERLATREEHIVSKLRTRTAIVLLAGALILNVVILARGEESFGWPLAAIVLIGAVAIALVVERRPWR